MGKIIHILSEHIPKQLPRNIPYTEMIPTV
jgi:hypothetical protein